MGGVVSASSFGFVVGGFVVDCGAGLLISGCFGCFGAGFVNFGTTGD